jgi:S1-C subfamily serine protease
MSLQDLHEKVLKTQVRVKTDKAGGSGTIIYSKPNKSGSYSTYILTCHHVIEDAITIKKEYRKAVTVEFFDYDNVKPGTRPINYSVDGDIVAYDKAHDMALIKLRTKKKVENVAKLYPKKPETGIKIGQKVWAVGAALLHDPILTQGIITHMGDEIDYKDYWMSNAQIIFGNSGGAIFLDETFEFIGIPSRIDIVGWATPVTHLGYFSPIHRVYEFLDSQLFQFIYDDKYTEEECEAEREKLKKLEQERLKALLPTEEEKESSPN